MSKKNTNAPIPFFENFAKWMEKSSQNQSDWWKQAGISMEIAQKYQEFAHESQQRLKEFMEGVKLYQSLDFKREMPDPPIIWAMGAARLLDYSDNPLRDAPVVLIIPSLINKSYVLDLSHQMSFVRQMAKAGVRPFLLDWGDLSSYERNFSFEDYLNQFVLPAFDHLTNYTRQSPSLFGYCIGGMFALAACQERPKAQKLILLATPWDFHVGQEWLLPWLYSSSTYLNNLIDQSAELPVEILQYMFAILNPLGIIRKFSQLPQFSDNFEKLQEFASVEDWLNDCVPLAPKVAKELLFDWYRDNKPIKGEWLVNKKAFNPMDVHQPTLIVAPTQDKIVSPHSADALTKYLPNSHILRPETGHIGAVIGKKSIPKVLEPIVNFINNKNEGYVL